MYFKSSDYFVCDPEISLGLKLFQLFHLFIFSPSVERKLGPNAFYGLMQCFKICYEGSGHSNFVCINSLLVLSKIIIGISEGFIETQRISLFIFIFV